MIQSTLDWLSGLTDSDFMAYEIPVVNKEVGELFDFATSFSDRVISQIDFDQINTVQDFIEQFTDAGILPAGMDVVYDAATRSLTLPVNFTSLLNDFDLRNLQNLGQLDYSQLLDWGAIDPEQEFDKDTILDGLLGIIATPLDEMARWNLFDVGAFNPSTSISVSDLVDLDLIEDGDLPAGTISLSNLLSSTDVNVSLEDLFEYDLLSAANLLSGRKIAFDDLIDSRLMSASDLIAAGVALYKPNTSAMLNISTLESEGIIDPGALDSLGVTQISVGELLESELVDVEIGDLVDAGLSVLETTTEAAEAAFADLDNILAGRAYSFSDALSMGLIAQDEFNLSMELAISALEAAELIDPGALGTGNITLEALLESTDVSVSLADLIEAELVDRGDLLDLANVAAGALGIEGFDLGGLVDLGLLEQSDIVSFHYDIFNLQDQPIDLGFDVGDVLELGTTATADIQVSVEGGLEWVIDFDGETGTEGFTFLINNAYVSGRASLDVEDLEFFAKLGFMSLTAGGEGTDSGVHLLAEATITLDEDGDIETVDDRQFSFTDLVSGGLIDNFLFDFNGMGEARLKSLDVSPNIPGLDETGLNNMELSITIPDLLNWDTVEVVEGDTSAPSVQQQIQSHLEQDHVVIVVPDFSNAFNFRDMDFGAIIDAIRTGVEFIETALQDTDFYDQNIPIINRSVEDSFAFVEDMLDKIELAAEDPAAALQEVEDIIEDALGLTDEDALQLSLDPDDSEVIKVHIEWDKMLSDFLDEEYMNLSFAFNLGDMIGIFTGTVGTGWDFLDDLVSAGADISWDAFVSMTAEVGIDFSDIESGDVDFFLYDYDAHGAGPEDDTGTRIYRRREGRGNGPGADVQPVRNRRPRRHGLFGHAHVR